MPTIMYTIIEKYVIEQRKKGYTDEEIREKLFAISRELEKREETKKE